MPALQATGLAVFRTLRELILLERATRTAASYDEVTRTRLRALVREGHDRAVVASRAVGEGDDARGLRLYAEAAQALMRARLAVEGAEPPLDVPATDLVARFRALTLGGPRAGDTALEAVAAPEARAPAEGAIVGAATTVRWLGTLVEPRGVAELRFERRLRVGLAGLVILALVAWPVSAALGPKNVALHKPVTMSGTFPGAPTTPDGLTDGVITDVPFGVHTNVGDPWVEVDLLGVYRIDRVKVYNRGDGFLEDTLPLTLRMSEDRVHYVDVATRATSFEQSAPWVARAGKRTARYVRIVGRRGSYIALSELEVFGSKP